MLFARHWYAAASVFISSLPQVFFFSRLHDIVLPKRGTQSFLDALTRNLPLRERARLGIHPKPIICIVKKHRHLIDLHQKAITVFHNRDYCNCSSNLADLGTVSREGWY